MRQEIQDVPFEGIQSGEALNTRQCDIAAAAITINPVREENFDYYDTNSADRVIDWLILRDPRSETPAADRTPEAEPA